jgi:tetratricopeptide (TPR) repeat protein
MNTIFFQVVFGSATLYFGALIWQILPTLLKLLGALITRAVKWPGPRIHDPGLNASILRSRLGVGYQNLFPTFLENAGGVIAGFFFSLLTFLSNTPVFAGYVMIKSLWGWLFLSLVALVSANMAFRKAKNNCIQVNAFLSSVKVNEEPRMVAGQSAESEYAIEHPLVVHKGLKAESKRALDMYYESVCCFQEGNDATAMTLNQAALDMDPSMHEHAYQVLSEMTKKCNPMEAGPIYYWLGIHAEHLRDWKQAAAAYEQAIQAFAQLGYRKRESRVHCNLGTVKMRLNDPSGMEEYEKAIALNPRDGTAHLSIARLYYTTSADGGDRFERALDEFADAILADPLTYGPMVVASLRQIGYNWKEDLQKITRKIEEKGH